MDRLTSWDEDCVQINGHALGYATIGELLQMAERLAAYEDTGLEPEAVETVKLALVGKHLADAETMNNTPISRLVELAEADKAGRCVVLPCKVGDMVYEINRIFDIDSGVRDEIFPKKIIGYGGNSLNKVWLIASGDYCNYSMFPSEFGKTVFLTREEAERAMENRKDG